jgi:hypothetical protein
MGDWQDARQRGGLGRGERPDCLVAIENHRCGSEIGLGRAGAG